MVNIVPENERGETKEELGRYCVIPTSAVLPNGNKVVIVGGQFGDGSPCYHIMQQWIPPMNGISDLPQGKALTHTISAARQWVNKTFYPCQKGQKPCEA